MRLPPRQESANWIRRSIHVRIEGLEETVRRLAGSLSESQVTLRIALNLFLEFATSLGRVVEVEWTRNDGDPESQIQLLIPLLRHLNSMCTFVERHLSHGTRRELSEALVEATRVELDSLNLSHYQVVLSHGDADNFETTYGDVEAMVFSPLSGLDPNPPVLTGNPYALFKMPRIEGASVLWKPILLGHEIAHIAVHEFDGVQQFQLPMKFDFKKAGKLSNPLAGPTSTEIEKRQALYTIAVKWLTELLCDAYAIYRFGPAAIAALADYLTTVGGMEAQSKTHPPGTLRLDIASGLLGAVGDRRLAGIVEPWCELAPSSSLPPPSPWVEELVRLFTSHQQDLFDVVDLWPADPYPWNDRTNLILHQADRLKSGVPGDETVRSTGSVQLSHDADVINGAWVAQAEDSETPVDRLAQKCLDTLSFLRHWQGGGGNLPLAYGGSKPPLAAEMSSDDTNPRTAGLPAGLIISPLLQIGSGDSVDLRLGNRFIVFRRTGISSFDPIEELSDPRSLQVFLELAWTDSFVLHPSEMVLGSTLEYIVTPAGIGGQVITRSSYGRLGLLSATAVQVHPHFHGCLTLELVNLSNIPLVLTPGERVTQLVTHKVPSEAAPVGKKYSYSTGPEFSKVREDPDATILRALRAGRRSAISHQGA